MCGGKSSSIGPTYEQQVSADINQQMFDYYQKTYKPLITKYTAKVTDAKETEMEKNKVSGQINADVMKNATPASSTNSVVNQKKLMTLADAKSSSLVKGDASVREKNIGEKENIVNLGKGQVTKAMAGLEELASMSVEPNIRYIERRDDEAATKRNAIGSTIGTMIGVSGYGLRGKGLTVGNGPKSEYEAELDYYGYEK